MNTTKPRPPYTITVTTTGGKLVKKYECATKAETKATAKKALYIASRMDLLIVDARDSKGNPCTFI